MRGQRLEKAVPETHSGDAVVISKVGWGHCVLSSLLSPKRLERRPSLDSCALASAPHDAYARVLLLRALVFNRYLISLCADGRPPACSSIAWRWLGALAAAHATA